MSLLEDIVKLSDEEFKRVIGVRREVFLEMTKILQEEYLEIHKKKGRHRKLSIEEQLLMTLKYLRQYVTQKELSIEFSVGEATVCDTIKWVEDTLVESEIFRLEGKKALKQDETLEVIAIDVTESPIQRPQKNKKLGIRARKNVIQ